MRVFKDLDLVEQLGSGVPRILETYSKTCFKFSDNFLRMFFPINIERIIIPNKGGTIGGAILELTERQNEVLSIIAEDPAISYRLIARHLNINESAVLKHINILKEKGFIVRKGGTRGKWEILIN